ncbi:MULTISPECIES: alpha/beta hydrolase [Methylobacterium]|uniref:Monoterpene epsilon-lactone hydrolase n=1 Tax=Methylobacterium thuringiense TaxID=1003091 RepID=A0ABQ4TJN9_9HYPH|nr:MULTISPECIES: alpha/beta hydrolase [Methylobacterium]TXN23931.1 alpha/beta hydrolase [Methylobacterium sp. WL9]GJE55196.1 Monoterpene epsilon-lactone hydrolase [Methylobacterium thuringiense]
MNGKDIEELNAVRAMLGSKPRPVGWSERRARLDEVGSVWPIAEDIVLEATTLAGVPCEWSTSPGADAARVLVYFHGGGYCSGSIASHRRLVTEAGRAAGARTLAVGYRRAPEHPYPAALDDALSVWTGLLRLGFDPAQVAVAGDSAGGGLTLALVQHLRTASQLMPGCLWLISPWTDLTLSGVSLAAKSTVDPLISRHYLAELVDAYLSVGHDRADPLVSPLFANLSGLPPTLIQVGSDETLLDDATRLAAAMGAADIAVTLEIWPHMIHAWPLWNARLDAGRRAIAAAGAFLQARLK